jgi:hypothetical protein
MLSGEATITNFILLGLTPWSTALEASMLTITLQMQFNGHFEINIALKCRYHHHMGNIYKIYSRKYKCNAKCGVSPCLKIWPGDLDLWPWRSIGFQILLRTKHVSSLVKIHWKNVDSRVFTRMLWKDGSITISLRNFAGEGIIRTNHIPSKVTRTYHLQKV